jgi:predicted metal-binding membrane protein
VPDLESVATLPRRDRLLIAACLLAMTALAWAYLFRLESGMSTARAYDAAMAAMGMATNASWSAADFWYTFSMWVVMMVGMMAAAAAPVLLIFAATVGRRQERGMPVSVLAFGFGYLVVWTAFSACAAAAQWSLHQAALLSPSMKAASPTLGGAILAAAGVYQLTPVKRACLAHCRSPLGFLMTHWRDGTAGAFDMGRRHGLYCLGCCWAIMAVLFAVGVMNLVWVAALSTFVLIEKLAPAGAAVARVAGTLLIAAGIILTLAAL